MPYSASKTYVFYLFIYFTISIGILIFLQVILVAGGVEQFFGIFPTKFKYAFFTIKFIN